MTKHSASGDRREDEALKAILEGTARQTGERFFAHLVKHLAEVFDIQGVWVTEYVREQRRLRAIAFWFDGDWISDYEYDFSGTPCEPVVENRTLLHIPERVVDLFPADHGLKDGGSVSYLGVPLLSPEGEFLGHLAALDTKPMPQDFRLLAIFQIFAARASAELQKRQAEARLTERDRRLQVLLSEAQSLRHELAALKGPREILGTSEAVKRMLENVDDVAATDATVLVQGETGTGKELVARAIHAASRRRKGPFVTVNCGALPEALIESELFGHEKGAFTGAAERRDGRFTLADGGTIFLDEIGDLPLPLQVRFLRVLQEGEFEPVGSSRVRHVDVRVVAATHRDLAKAVAEGAFRGDLYFRLNVYPIDTPPLRERGDDVILLARAFAERYAAELGRRLEPLTPAMCQVLKRYSWPGNIRELENIIERAVIASRDGRLDLTRALPGGAAATPGTTRPMDAASTPDGVSEAVLTVRQLKDLERSNILRALEATNWRIAGSHAASALLQISPSTLASRMKALGIKRPPRA